MLSKNRLPAKLSRNVYCSWLVLSLFLLSRCICLSIFSANWPQVIDLMNRMSQTEGGPRSEAKEGKLISSCMHAARTCGTQERAVRSLDWSHVFYPIKDIDRLQLYHSRDFIRYVVLNIWGQFHRAAKQRKLLTRNICLADFLGYQPNFHVKLMYLGW